MSEHDGNLGHNSTVFYKDDPYSDVKDGETFYVKSVAISDKTRCVTLTPQEALSLLAWLEQERATLEQLAHD